MKELLELLTQFRVKRAVIVNNDIGEIEFFPPERNVMISEDPITREVMEDLMRADELAEADVEAKQQAARAKAEKLLYASSS